ncbi:hypothetical protein FQN60_008093 [Etheostoma spectabile]|uniref:Uncharacterized protein n=1 Tax=Etheostoma spectabile TaxID=54343 RepID=A0A5J5CQ52_9PERO|nr:hypothetical protein FQN60_008093 [Etheostoma spectabile]
MGTEGGREGGRDTGTSIAVLEKHQWEVCATLGALRTECGLQQVRHWKSSLGQRRMAHVLQFDEQTRKVKDAAMQDEDTFEIYDPRNPVNKRRREESKKIMKEKKAKVRS